MHEFKSLKIVSPQLLHCTLTSEEKISTSSPHRGHFLTVSVGVLNHRRRQNRPSLRRARYAVDLQGRRHGGHPGTQEPAGRHEGGVARRQGVEQCGSLAPLYGGRSSS